jgi:hypothetical protein
LGEGLNAYGLEVDHEVEEGITRLGGFGIIFDVITVHSVDHGLDQVELAREVRAVAIE